RHTSCLSDWSSDVCSSDLDRSLEGAIADALKHVDAAVIHDTGATLAGCHHVQAVVAIHIGDRERDVAAGTVRHPGLKRAVAISEQYADHSSGRIKSAATIRSTIARHQVWLAVGVHVRDDDGSPSRAARAVRDRRL